MCDDCELNVRHSTQQCHLQHTPFRIGEIKACCRVGMCCLVACCTGPRLGWYIPDTWEQVTDVLREPPTEAKFWSSCLRGECAPSIAGGRGRPRCTDIAHKRIMLVGVMPGDECVSSTATGSIIWEGTSVLIAS